MNSLEEHRSWLQHSLAEAQNALAAGDRDRARSLYLEILAKHPDCPEVYYSLGELFARDSLWEQAREYYAKAKELAPIIPNIDEKLQEVIAKADLLYAKRQELQRDADNAFSEGNIERAQELYHELHSLCPELAHPLCRLGEIALRNADLTAAEQYYRQAIACQTDYVWAYEGLGRTLARQNRWGSALEAFRQAQHLRPDSAYLQQLLAEAEREAAYQSAQIAERLSRADQCFDAKDFVEAERQYLETLNISGDPPVHALCRLGIIAMQRQEIYKAENYFRQAIQADQGYAWGYCGLGDALMAQEKWGAAQEAFSRALALKPDNSYIVSRYRQSRSHRCLQAAEAALEQGKTDEAKQILSLAMVIDPESSQVRDMVRRLLGTLTVMTYEKMSQYILEVELNNYYNCGLEKLIGNMTSVQANQ